MSDLKQLLAKPPGWENTVGRYDQASLKSHVTAKRADQMEAIMILARGMRDADGKASPCFIPPALALAICDTILRDKPVSHAMQVIAERGNRR